MNVTCPTCGRLTRPGAACECCGTPLSPDAGVASKEILPRLQSLTGPAALPLDDPDEPLPVLPAPPRPSRREERLPALRLLPATGKNRWPLVLGIAAGIVFLGAVAFGVLLVSGSLLGSRTRDPTPAIPIDKAAERAAQEKAALEKAKAASLPQPVINKMLELAKPKVDETLIDLGCGDGRLAMEAAERGCSVLAWDNDPILVKLTARLAEEQHREHLVKVQRTDDVLGVDLRQAHIIVVSHPERWGSLLEVSKRLEPLLFALKPGVRIVSPQPIGRPHPPLQTVPVAVPDDARRQVTVYLYETPLD
jgi:precorrin-6B methylase 2